VDSGEKYERGLDEAYSNYKQRRLERGAKLTTKQACEENKWARFSEKKNRDRAFDSKSNCDKNDSGSDNYIDSDIMMKKLNLSTLISVSRFIHSSLY
jgi:hypothetical protein